MGNGNGAIAVADKNVVTISADAGVISDEAMWQLIADGDLSKLTDRQKSNYYIHLCQSVGLNPATQPFRYIVLNSKLTLYAQKGATDQLRKINGVDIIRIDKAIEDDLYVVTVAVRDKHGRVDEDMGAAPIKGLMGDAKVNAMLKAVTKAKRRATLSICGLGFLDETEVESIAQARVLAMRGDSYLPEMGQTEPAAAQQRSAPLAPPQRAPQAAPAPQAGIQEAEYREVHAGGEPVATWDDWTSFWRWARENGLPNKLSIEEVIGRAPDGLSPAELRGLIEQARGGNSADGVPEEPVLTDAQNRKLHARGAELFGKESHEILHALAELNYGADSVTKLSKTAASHLIDQLEQPKVDVDGIREYVAGVQRQQAIDRGQQEMPTGQPGEITEAEAALIAFRERAEASSDWEADGIYAAAGDSQPHWLELVAVAPAVPVLNRVTAHIKRKALFNLEVSDAISKRQRELRARADALTR